MPEPRLYFAYGANLNLEGMSWRCPGAKLVGPATLPDYRLIFRGVADIVRKGGCSVPGAVWELTPDCEKALDRFEGFPTLYRKRDVLLKLDGAPAAPMAYVMRGGKISAPWPGYEATIREGYRALGLDMAALDAAVAHAERHTEKHRAAYPARRT
jgi:gamma-glutamylcyclotransferase